MSKVDELRSNVIYAATFRNSKFHSMAVDELIQAIRDEERNRTVCPVCKNPCGTCIARNHLS